MLRMTFSSLQKPRASGPAPTLAKLPEIFQEPANVCDVGHTWRKIYYFRANQGHHGRVVGSELVPQACVISDKRGAFCSDVGWRGDCDAGINRPGRYQLSRYLPRRRDQRSGDPPLGIRHHLNHNLACGKRQRRNCRS